MGGTSNGKGRGVVARSPSFLCHRCAWAVELTRARAWAQPEVSEAGALGSLREFLGSGAGSPRYSPPHRKTVNPITRHLLPSVPHAAAASFDTFHLWFLHPQNLTLPFLSVSPQPNVSLLLQGPLSLF